MKNLGLFASALLLSLNLAATAEEPKAETKYESAVVTFAPGAATLNSEEMAKLRAAVKNAKAKGSITRVEVAVWSDKEHPIAGDLPKSDRKLANERMSTIRRDLRRDGLHNFAREYNMAENAHWLGRHLHSTEAELDAVFAKKEKSAIEREDLVMIRQEGAPSKAVVIFRIREK